MKKEGVIILAHGSRRKETAATTNSLVKKVKALLPEGEIYSAYLQLARPLLGDVVKVLVDDQMEKITIVPMFIFAGIHVTEDIPNEVEALRKEFPGVDFVLTGHIGDDDRLAGIIAERVTGDILISDKGRG